MWHIIVGLNLLTGAGGSATPAPTVRYDGWRTKGQIEAAKLRERIAREDDEIMEIAMQLMKVL